MSKSTWDLISEDQMTYVNCMTNMELPARSYEAGNYTHKNICFYIGTGIKKFEVRMGLYDKNRCQLSDV